LSCCVLLKCCLLFFVTLLSPPQKDRLTTKKNQIGYWLLAIGMLLLLYLLVESWQRSRQIEEALKQTPSAIQPK
jgi:hypothetical protein